MDDELAKLNCYRAQIRETRRPRCSPDEVKSPPPDTWTDSSYELTGSSHHEEHPTRSMPCLAGSVLAAAGRNDRSTRVRSKRSLRSTAVDLSRRVAAASRSAAWSSRQRYPRSGAGPPDSVVAQSVLRARSAARAGGRRTDKA